MDGPKIISLGYAVPDQAITQDEAWEALGYQSRHLKRIFTDSEIDRRHVWIHPRRLKEMSWQELCDEYKVGALTLSVGAIDNCLDGRDVSKIGCIVFGSTTGFQCPAMSYRIAREIGLASDVEHYDIVGDGCQGSLPVSKAAYNFARLSEHSLRPWALAISAEICTATYFPEGEVPDPENGYELLRSNAIFADGASAALIGYDTDPRHPQIMDFESYFNPDFLGHLGYRWVDGRLRVILSREVPRLSGVVAKIPVLELLYRNRLTSSEIEWLVVHPGGKAILDNIRDAIHFSEVQMRFSRRGLREFGNCSSATVGIIGKLMMEDKPESGWGLIVSMGAGFACQAVVLRFG